MVPQNFTNVCKNRNSQPKENGYEIGPIPYLQVLNSDI